jgi:hypothetical protein
LKPLLQPLPSAAATEHKTMLLTFKFFFNAALLHPLQLNIKFLVLREKEEKKK